MSVFIREIRGSCVFSVWCVANPSLTLIQPGGQLLHDDESDFGFEPRLPTSDRARNPGETMSTPAWTIRRLHMPDDTQINKLADVLIDCVEGGASVSFMLPLSRERAGIFWRRVAQGVTAGERALLIAEDAHGVCGTVQLILSQPENQPHRADVAKMLVHRRVRRQGLGAALMRAAETLAWECGKTLLVLDTVTGAEGERLYERLGWKRVGSIPDYALMPDGAPCSTTIFYRELNG
jgi:GNAT superfamily N-acetyltransferase